MTNPQRVARRHHLIKAFWIIVSPFYVIGPFVLSFEVYAKITLCTTALYSLYANWSTDESAEQAAEGRT